MEAQRYAHKYEFFIGRRDARIDELVGQVAFEKGEKDRLRLLLAGKILEAEKDAVSREERDRENPRGRNTQLEVGKEKISRLVKQNRKLRDKKKKADDRLTQINMQSKADRGDSDDSDEISDGS